MRVFEAARLGERFPSPALIAAQIVVGSAPAVGVAPPGDEGFASDWEHLMSFGITEILILAALVLLLFGAKAVPRLARGFGSVRGEFEAGQRGDREQ
jgi:TatA/E family protein of Tat protein translocase